MVGSPWLSKPIKPMKDTKMKPKYAGWYCNQCDFVHYNASQNDVDEHLKTHDESDTKIKPDWEKEYHDKFYPLFNGLAAADGPLYYDYYDEIFNFIRNLLAKQEEQHKAEINDWLRRSREDADKDIQELKQQHKAEMAKAVSIAMKMIIEDRDTAVKRLKQQHRAELEGLKMDEKNIEPNHFFAWKNGYKQAISEINEAITNLLEQKGK